MKILEEAYSPELMEKLDEYCKNMIKRLDAFYNHNKEMFDSHNPCDHVAIEIANVCRWNRSAAKSLSKIKNQKQWIKKCAYIRRMEHIKPELFKSLWMILLRNDVFEELRH